LAYARIGLGRALRRAGRGAEALGPLREAVALWEALPAPNIDSHYDLACAHALLAAVAADPRAGLSAADGAAEAGRAMGALRRAVAAGYRDLDRLRTDPDLAPLRDRPEFQELLLDLAFPADPFTR
jgi:hypothetical protein